MKWRKTDQLDRLLENSRQDPGELADLLETADQLSILRDVPDMPPESAAAGRRAFLAQAARLRREREQIPSRPAGRRIRIWPPARALLRPTLLLILLAIAVIGVIAAQAASPASPLYPVKLASEDLRLALTRDPQNRAELSLTFAERRVEEILQLVQDEHPVPERVLARMEHHLQICLDSSALLPDQALEHILQRLKQHTEERVRLVEQVMGQSSGPAQEALRTTANILAQTGRWAEAGLSDPASFRRASDRGFAPAPTPTPRPVPSQQTQPTGTPPLAATPTANPTVEHPPTPVPTMTPQPTLESPTPQPTPTPTKVPTRAPTQVQQPTPTPTTVPTHNQRGTPTPQPTHGQGGKPTPKPTHTPRH